MHEPSDARLLRDYVRLKREAAFSELVKRHTNLVYSAALRQVESAHLAAEISQGAFIALARGSEALVQRLAEEASLAGWLCRTVRNLSLNLRRDEFRRHARETQAMEQFAPNPESPPDWERLRPFLDDAMSGLDEPDYDALVMRFFESRDLRSVGLALGVTEDTAQKRVARALEKLREQLSGRGITTTAAALSLVITANGVQSAPMGLASAISTAVALSRAALVATTATALKPIAMTTLQKTLVTCALAVTIGATVYESHQVAKSRDELQMLRKQQTTEASRLQNDHDASTKSSPLIGQGARDNGNLAELLKLRAEVTRLRNQIEAAQLASKNTSQSQTQVGQARAKTSPSTTYVSTTLSSISWDQSILAGGWKTPSGKRAAVLVSVQRMDDPKQLTINSTIFEYTDDAAKRLGLSQYNIDSHSTSTAHTLSSDQAQAFLQAAKNSDGIEISAEPRVTTASGNEAGIEMVDKHMTPSGEEYSTGPWINFVPLISPDGQAVQIMVDAKINFFVPPQKDNP